MFEDFTSDEGVLEGSKEIVSDWVADVPDFSGGSAVDEVDDDAVEGDGTGDDPDVVAGEAHDDNCGDETDDAVEDDDCLVAHGEEVHVILSEMWVT